MSKAVDQSKDFPVSWEEMHRNSKALAWRLVDKGPWKGIVAVTRGGMVPACIVARELDLKLIETLCISSYDHKNQRDAQILHKPEGIGDGKGWLVVDDLVDTGNTFKIARELMPKAHYVCIYAKPLGAKLTDTYITEVSQDTWIHFPWDMEAKYSAPIAAARTGS
ncbi:MAG TPA: xanthine phosphoribosyltransferase [Patescibacteria group bacterium]|nr:xanthine phosphoribosyltransferase [Patescibacteria group bacterium]